MRLLSASPAAAALSAPPAAPAAPAAAALSSPPASPAAALQAILSRTWMVPAGRYPEPTFARRRRRRSPLLLPLTGAAAVLICAGIAVGVVGSGHSRVAAVATPGPVLAQCGVGTGDHPVPEHMPVPVLSLVRGHPGAPASRHHGPDHPGTAEHHPVRHPQRRPFSEQRRPLIGQPLDEAERVAAAERRAGLGRDWGSLNVALARKSGASSVEAFFFNANTPVGVDVPDYTGSTSPQPYRIDHDTIDIRYKLENAPSGFADVRFQLQNDQLVRLDSMPAASNRRW